MRLAQRFSNKCPARSRNICHLEVAILDSMQTVLAASEVFFEERIIEDALGLALCEQLEFYTTVNKLTKRISICTAKQSWKYVNMNEK